MRIQEKLIKPVRFKKPWDLWEILLIYLLSDTDENLSFASDLLKRSKGAIQWVWRQIEEGKVIGSDPKSAQNRIQDLIEQVIHIFPPSKYCMKVGGTSETPPQYRDPIRCIYCGDLPAVHHYHCNECGSPACCLCIQSDDEHPNFTCRSCAKDLER